MVPEPSPNNLQKYLSDGLRQLDNLTVLLVEEYRVLLDESYLPHQSRQPAVESKLQSGLDLIQIGRVRNDLRVHRKDAEIHGGVEMLGDAERHQLINTGDDAFTFHDVIPVAPFGVFRGVEGTHAFVLTDWYTAACLVW